MFPFRPRVIACELRAIPMSSETVSFLITLRRLLAGVAQLGQGWLALIPKKLSRTIQLNSGEMCSLSSIPGYTLPAKHTDAQIRGESRFKPQADLCGFSSYNTNYPLSLCCHVFRSLIDRNPILKKSV